MPGETPTTTPATPTTPTISVADAVSAVLAVASALLPVREATPNSGRFVDAIIRSAGGTPPEPWCASFVFYCALHALGGQWPLPRTRSCDVILEFARSKSLVTPLPTPGGLFLVLKTPSDAVHMGFVEQLRPDKGPGAFQTLEGNSNERGSRDGIGVFRNVRADPSDKGRYLFADWSRLIAPAHPFI